MKKQKKRFVYPTGFKYAGKKVAGNVRDITEQWKAKRIKPVGQTFFDRGLEEIEIG